MFLAISVMYYWHPILISGLPWGPQQAGQIHWGSRPGVLNKHLWCKGEYNSVSSPVYQLAANIGRRQRMSNGIWFFKARKCLEIMDISDVTAPPEGGKKILLFCEKVSREDIKVNTDSWLADTVHMTWILASYWSIRNTFVYNVILPKL